jgi:hypothetical protein
MTLTAKTNLIAVVTDNCYRAIDSLRKLGIGPWKMYTLDDSSVSDSVFRGQPNSSALRIGIAEGSGITWEVIQPLSGEGVHQEHLRRHGESYFHVSLDLGSPDFSTRVRELQDQGFRIVQSATWLGAVKYAFFEAANSPGMLFETICVPPDFAFPEPDSWYPASA